VGAEQRPERWRFPQWIYHVKCHAKAMALTDNLAACLWNELTSGHCAGTPEISSH
jgi:hypothetical protein